MSLLDTLMIQRILITSITMAVGTLILFYYYLGHDMIYALTISMTTLAVFQWFNAWNCRSDRESIFTMNPFANPYLIAATITVFILQFFAVYTPFLQKILHTTAITLTDWGLILAVSSSIIVVEEIRKLIVRHRTQHTPHAS